MSQLVVSKVFNQFDFNGIPARVIQDDRFNFWWVAYDICSVLGVNNTSQAISTLDDDEKSTLIINEGLVKQGLSDNLPGTNLNIVSESGLYALLFKSRKPEARRFRKWVTSEVIPSIRKNGYYQLNQKGIERGAVKVRKKPAKSPLDRLLPDGTSFAMIERDVRKLSRLYANLGYGDSRQKVVDQISSLYGEQVRGILSPDGIPTDKPVLPPPALSPESVSIAPVLSASLPICPTDIAEAIGLPSAQVVNQALADAGYQVKSLTIGSPAWVPTRKGMDFSFVRTIPLKVADDPGREAHQLLWNSSIMNQPDFISACADKRTGVTPGLRRAMDRSAQPDLFGRGVA